MVSIEYLILLSQNFIQILSLVVNHSITTQVFQHFGLFSGASEANHVGAPLLSPLYANVP